MSNIKSFLLAAAAAALPVLATAATACTAQPCYAALISSAPDPTEYCQLFGILDNPLPNNAGVNCDDTQISAACACATASPSPSSSLSSASATLSASSSLLTSLSTPYPLSTGGSVPSRGPTGSSNSTLYPPSSVTGQSRSGTVPVSGSPIPTTSSARYPLTNSSTPITASETQSTGSSGASQKSGSASVSEIITTDIVTSYTTVCPVTSTFTSGGSRVISTGLSTSTVYSTKIITVCTHCTAKPTSAPSQSGGKSPAGVSTQDVVTSVFTYTTTTTCPITKTVTSTGVIIVQTTETVSTVTSTATSTICTNCIAPASASKLPAVAAQSPAAAPTPATAGVNSANSPQQPTNSPSNVNSPGQNNSENNNSPATSAASGPANSPASPALKFETLTLIPVPITATQTDYSAVNPTAGANQAAASSSVANINHSNGTSLAKPSGSGTTSSPFAPSTEAFTGAAGRVGVGSKGTAILFMALAAGALLAH